jgi:hypothetical protein
MTPILFWLLGSFLTAINAECVANHLLLNQNYMSTDVKESSFFGATFSLKTTSDSAVTLFFTPQKTPIDLSNYKALSLNISAVHKKKQSGLSFAVSIITSKRTMRIYNSDQITNQMTGVHVPIYHLRPYTLSVVAIKIDSFVDRSTYHIGPLNFECALKSNVQHSIEANPKKPPVTINLSPKPKEQTTTDSQKGLSFSISGNYNSSYIGILIQSLNKTDSLIVAMFTTTKAFDDLLEPYSDMFPDTFPKIQFLLRSIVNEIRNGGHVSQSTIQFFQQLLHAGKFMKQNEVYSLQDA